MKKQQQLVGGILTTVAIAIGQTDRVKELIDKLYMKNQATYILYEKEHITADELYFLDMYSVKYMKQLKEIFIILKHAVGEENYSIIYPLLKKTHTGIYKLYMEHAEVKTNAVLNVLKKEKDLAEYSEGELVCAYAVSTYLALTANKAVFQADEITQQLKMVVESRQADKLVYRVSVKGSELPEIEMTVEEQKIVEYLKKNYTFKGQFETNKFLDNIIDAEHAQKLGVTNLYGKEINTISDREVSAARKEIFKDGGTVSAIGALSGILKLYGFFEQQYTQVLSATETERFFSYIAKVYDENNLKQSMTIEMFLVVASHSLQVLDELELSKVLYREEMTSSIKKEVQNAYEQRIDGLTGELERTVKENKKINEKYINVKERLSISESEITKLEKHIKELEKNAFEYEMLKKEVVSLREYVYENDKQQDAFAEDTLTMDAVIQNLEELKIVVVGGNIKWQQKMKDVLPNIKFIQIDKTGSFSSLSNEGTIVVINTLANKHANYEKMLRMVHPANKIMYINAHVNIDISIKTLHNMICKV